MYKTCVIEENDISVCSRLVHFRSIPLNWHRNAAGPRDLMKIILSLGAQKFTAKPSANKSKFQTADI